MRCTSRSKPYLPARGFQVTRTLMQNRKHCRGLPTASPGPFGLCRPVSLSRARWLGSAAGFGFPCSPRWARSHPASSASDFSWGLGSTDSCATAVHTTAFSTSTLKAIVCVFATTTKICTGCVSRRGHAQNLPSSPARPPTRRVSSGFAFW